MKKILYITVALASVSHISNPYDLNATELCTTNIDISDCKTESILIRDTISMNGQIDSRDELIQAMIWVESRGIDSAYNETEGAVGCLQIRPIMISELNRLCEKFGYPERWVHTDAWDREKSIRMFEVWTDICGIDSLYEKSARNWNGGPYGYTKTATVGYWSKCKTYAEENL